jgi:hypothetical protein
MTLVTINSVISIGKTVALKKKKKNTNSFATYATYPKKTYQLTYNKHDVKLYRQAQDERSRK